MTTYTFIAEGKLTRSSQITDFDIMQMCAGGGVMAFNSGVLVEFFDKDDAIKAKETLEAHGVKVGPVVESDNPSYYEVN